MKHAFSNATGDDLIAAINALTSTTRVDDNGRSQQQVVMIALNYQSTEWVVVMGDAANGDPSTPNETQSQRVFSSPELSHALYSALVDHPVALQVFKLATGWSK